MGVLAIFYTGTYAIVGTTCVDSETCYEKYHEKKTYKVRDRHTNRKKKEGPLIAVPIHSFFERCEKC